MRIDAYVQHLIRHGATELELASNRPAKFQFSTGERLSASSVSHKELVFIVHEIANDAEIDELQRTRRVELDHEADGMSVHMVVEIAGNEAWTIRLAPRGSAMTAVVQRQTRLDPPMPQVPRDRPSVAPPRVEARAGQPRIDVLLREMVRLGASDLHLSTGVEPMLRLHGAMTTLEKHGALKADELRALLAEILPDRNASEFERDWDSDFAYAIEDVARFRANYFVDRNGPAAVFRQIPYDLFPVEKLGLSPKVLELCWLTKGLVVVTGPTGSGKSTTLATLINYINENRADHIITIEDPIEFVHKNKRCLVNQREVGTHTRTFKSALRAALREDPDVVLVGEMRDLETISIALETAETGHLVFGTLHTTSATSTVDRMIDQFPSDQQAQIRTMLSEALRGVIAQVLCKKKGGGRVAAYEVMLTTPAVSNLIREGKTYQLASLLQTGRQLGMQTMNEHLLSHVRAGLVEPEEAFMKSNDKGSFRDALQKAGISLKL